MTPESTQHSFGVTSRQQWTCGLTFEFTRVRRLAKPAVARRLERRVRPHCGCPRCVRSLKREAQGGVCAVEPEAGLEAARPRRGCSECKTVILKATCERRPSARGRLGQRGRARAPGMGRQSRQDNELRRPSTPAKYSSSVAAGSERRREDELAIVQRLAIAHVQRDAAPTAAQGGAGPTGKGRSERAADPGGLTFEFTRVRRLAQPAVARRCGTKG